MGRRFKFEAFWVKAEGFMDTVVEAWTSVPSNGNPYVALDNKLRATAKSLKKWSDRWIGNVKLQVAIALEIILLLDKAMDTRELSPPERELRKLLKRKLLGLSSLERSIVRQRSRLIYLREGDGNTRLFHQSACHRQRRNMISMLSHNNEIATTQDDIAGMVDSYYDNLLGTAPHRPHAINLDQLQLPSMPMTQLDVEFTEEEIEKVVKSMPLDKAPGPDEFTRRFFATCWPVIKDDIMSAFDYFFRGDMRGLPAINKAIVSLLPKVDGAVDVKDFRPVSLVHGAIKIFDKALSNRVAVELPNLVGKHQSAFVKG